MLSWLRRRTLPDTGGAGDPASQPPGDLAALAAAFYSVTRQVQVSAREQRRIRELITAERDLVDSVLEVAGSSTLVMVLDHDGRIIHFNRACESTTGYSSAEVKGKKVSELFLPPDEIENAAPAFGEPASPAVGPALPRGFACTWVGKDGARRQIAWSNASVEGGPDGAQVIATGIDMTDRRVAETELRRAQQRLRIAFEDAQIGMCLVRLDGRFVQVNKALCDMLGRSETELLRLRVTDVTHPADVQATLQVFAGMGTGETHAYHDEIRLLHADGRIVYALLSVSRAGPDSDQPLYHLQIQDVTARRAAEERLAQQALHDPLTRLPNRAALMERLQRELNRTGTGDGLTGVLCADLDGFKMINTRLGSVVGDQVLREVARRLKATVGSSGTVARFGDDEFIILCPDVPNQHDLLSLARRLADSVSAPLVVGGREVVVTMSVGVAISQPGDRNADRIVRNADVAMNLAKAGGRNGCRIFEESFSQYVLDRARIEDGLRQGLRNDHFVLEYQPIVDLTTRRVVAVESLLRLNHPRLGLMMPGSFVEIAEKSGLIVPIGAWVLHEACRTLASWRDEDPQAHDLLLTVNVSARQVVQADLVDTVASALAEGHVPAQSLALELTETALMETDIEVLRVLERLRDMGVRLGIDDFGTGYSSLVYLKRLPVDFVKIDRSFVSGLAPSSPDREIVTAIVGMGHALGLTVVAEGVERPEQLTLLQDLGCDRAQGYLFGRARVGLPDLAGRR
jgi:diguanylate cyclase (GGDEF)-like protein/PAS domain S-box-containing protein